MNLTASATKLIILRCWCGVQHAVPESLRNEQKRQHDAGENPRGIYCPLGHSHVPAGKSECDQLKERLARQIARHDQTQSRLRDTQASLSATRGVVTRFKNRVGHGVCPCCQRNFKNLRRHIETKHPAFAVSDSFLESTGGS